MKVMYDNVQDLTLMLTEEEKMVLTENLTKEFYDSPIRGASQVLCSNVFLAYSLDKSNILTGAKNMENLGKILIPDPDLRGYPWLINLSDEGIRHLRNGWNYGIRYNGSSKLFIKVNEF